MHIFDFRADVTHFVCLLRWVWSLQMSCWCYLSTLGMSHWTKNDVPSKKKFLLPLKRLQLLFLHQTPLPLPLHQHCPHVRLLNQLPVQCRAPGCPLTAPPVLLQRNTPLEQRVETICVRISPTSASLSWCHPMLSAMLLASFSPWTSSPIGLWLQLRVGLQSWGPQGPLVFAPLWTKPAQRQHLQDMESHLFHMVSYHAHILLD